MQRLFRRQRGRGHAGLGVGFQNHQSGQALGVVPAEVGAADPATAERVVGALGIVTRMTLQNRAPYRLVQKSWVEKTESVLETFDERSADIVERE